jgi:hypothetical protein
MCYYARNNEIRYNITRMRRDFIAQRDTLATVRRFNATLSAKGCLVLAEDRRHAQPQETDECNVCNTSNACSCNGHLADGWNR